MTTVKEDSVYRLFCLSPHNARFLSVLSSYSEGFFSSALQLVYVQGDTKKWELLKNPTKIEEIQEKKFIDRN